MTIHNTSRVQAALALACVLPLLAACSRHGGADPTTQANPDVDAAAVSTTSASTADEVSAPPGQLVEMGLEDASGEPLLLGAGATLSGTFTPLHTGEVKAFAVQVGTFAGRADGRLSVRLCAQDGRCSEGSSAIAGFEDNGYGVIALAAPFALDAGTPATYSLTRADGQRDFALWTYPAQGELTLPDGGRVARTAKIALQY